MEIRASWKTCFVTPPARRRTSSVGLKTWGISKQNDQWPQKFQHLSLISNLSSAEGKDYIKDEIEWGLKGEQGPAIIEQTISQILEVRCRRFIFLHWQMLQPRRFNTSAKSSCVDLKICNESRMTESGKKYKRSKFWFTEWRKRADLWDMVKWKLGVSTAWESRNAECENVWALKFMKKW